MNKIEEILQSKEPQNIGELIYELRKRLGFSRAEVRRTKLFQMKKHI